jgi:uncharacterized membrane protein (UPF0127 family)
MARGFRAIRLVAALGLALATAVFAPSAPAAGLPTSPLVIKSADGTEHRFTVELANTPAERERGLMFRESLPPDAGMLFDFQKPHVVAFWMKNTLIPLDMLFIGGDGRIRRIAERAVPLSLTPISSGVPVQAVLELNSGTAARLKLKPGDRVVHPIFRH